MTEAAINSLIEREYLNPTFTRSALDHVVIRKLILSAVKDALPRLSGTILDVGCGYKPYRSLFLSPPSGGTGYIGMDICENIYMGQGIDLAWNGKEIPLPDKSVDSAVATEFFEHCDAPVDVLREIIRVLRPGAPIFLTVPFLWPLHEVPHDLRRYTPFALELDLKSAGFSDIQIAALGGVHSAFAIMIGHWINSGITRRSLRRLASALAMPLLHILHRQDRKPSTFCNGTMITGLSAFAYRPGVS